MELADVEKALEGLRLGLRRDGADLNVHSVGGDCVDLSLIFKDSTCQECIVGTDLLLAKIRLALGKALTQVPKVVLHDPRRS